MTLKEWDELQWQKMAAERDKALKGKPLPVLRDGSGQSGYGLKGPVAYRNNVAINAKKKVQR